MLKPQVPITQTIQNQVQAWVGTLGHKVLFLCLRYIGEIRNFVKEIESHHKRKKKPLFKIGNEHYPGEIQEKMRCRKFHLRHRRIARSNIGICFYIDEILFGHIKA